MKHKVRLAGTYFLGEEVNEYLKELPDNSALELRHEPNNEFDSNAIKVISTNKDNKEVFIGYVPKTINEEVLAKINENANLTIVFKGKQNITISDNDNKDTNIFDLAKLLS